jgi:flagellar biosynthetic protein FliR
MAALVLALKYYLLMAVRVSGIIILFPGFGSSAFPRIAKVLIIFMISMMVIMRSHAVIVPAFEDNLIFAIYIVKEAFLGFFIGFFSQLPFMAVKAGGDIISFNTMFSMSSVLDPSQETRNTVWSEFYDIMSILIFFVMNGHLVVLKAIMYSFEKISVLNTVTMNQAVMDKITGVGSAIFLAGITIAAPVMLALFISNIGLGIVSRTMPQFNIFMVGTPLQIMLAIILVIVTIPVDTEIVRNLIQKMFRDIQFVISAL